MTCFLVASIIYSIILAPPLPQAYSLSNVAAPTHANPRGLPPTSTHVLPSPTQGQTMVVPFHLPLSLTTPTPSSLNPRLDSCSVCCFRRKCLSFALDPSQAELSMSSETGSCCPWLSIQFSRPPVRACPTSWLSWGGVGCRSRLHSGNLSAD